jgi:hypothetical protein
MYGYYDQSPLNGQTVFGAGFRVIQAGRRHRTLQGPGFITRGGTLVTFTLTDAGVANGELSPVVVMEAMWLMDAGVLVGFYGVGVMVG